MVLTSCPMPGWLWNQKLEMEKKWSVGNNSLLYCYLPLCQLSLSVAVPCYELLWILRQVFLGSRLSLLLGNLPTLNQHHIAGNAVLRIIRRATPFGKPVRMESIHSILVTILLAKRLTIILPGRRQIEGPIARVYGSQTCIWE